MLKLIDEASNYIFDMHRYFWLSIYVLFMDWKYVKILRGIRSIWLFCTYYQIRIDTAMSITTHSYDVIVYGTVDYLLDQCCPNYVPRTLVCRQFFKNHHEPHAVCSFERSLLLRCAVSQKSLDNTVLDIF